MRLPPCWALLGFLEMPSHASLFLLLGVSVLLFLMMGGCASTVSRREAMPRIATPPAPAQSRTVQVGRASWYGARHHGKVTASGEVYNQYALTAAHPTLPLGSRAVVTNLDNGKTVEVQINDRGPFVDGRVIDLSRGAAQVIGLVKPGIARVRVKTLSPRHSVRTRYRQSRRQRRITERECDSCQSQW
jgi:rare lipoprotein A (peptidoglycan hydrolase)